MNLDEDLMQEEETDMFDETVVGLFRQRSTGSFRKMIQAESHDLPEDLQTLTITCTSPDSFEADDYIQVPYNDGILIEAKAFQNES